MHKSLTDSVQYLKGIGPNRVKSLNKLGVNSVEDLLYYFPRRYEDRTSLLPIAKLEEGNTYTIKAEILSGGERYSFRRRGFNITEITVGDETGKVSCVWFNQPYLKEYFQVGEVLILYGKVELYAGRLQMSSPEFEIVSEGDLSLSAGRIVPLYTLPQRMTQRTLRKLIKNALDEYLPKIKDCLPFDVRSRNKLFNLPRSILNIHFPQGHELQKQAYERLSFEEFFLFQIPLALRKLKRREKIGIKHKVEGALVKDFLNTLPFQLTEAQERVISEIKKDMAGPMPMQRLLQGDVGSGKTVVATVAALFAMQGGYQAAFMVPTEILTRQHYEKISRQLKEINIALLSGSLTKKEKEKIYRAVKEGKVDLIIGTHALLEENVQFKNLGLVVIDEQHKFGVGQRSLLPQKGPSPDTLIMTATPIPRTLAITLYADLDISVINELPAGRQQVLTLHFAQADKARAFGIAKEELRQGRQAYIIYPVIEDSYALDIEGAKKMHGQLKAGEFKDFKTALIHGQLKQGQQEKIMRSFRDNELDILVATTVLEVGIDIANATCMIIDHAERFGLAQLHQLRGRVGRGSFSSSCVLISDAQTPEAAARIKAMISYSDGFRIAEEDLKIRGPGEFFGRRQHGLNELRIGNPLLQMQLLKRAREEAISLLVKDPVLGERQNALLKEKLLQRFPEYEKLILVA